MKTTVMLALLSTAGIAHAATPAKRAARYERYFERASAVVKAGGVAPYGTRRMAGVGATALIGGLDVGLGTQTVVERGMSQRYVLGSVRPSLGIGAGGGVTYFGGRIAAKKGELARSTLPRTAVADVAKHLGVIGTIAPMSGPGATRTGIDYFRFGLDAGATFTAHAKLGAARPSAMLLDIEEGRKLAQETRAAIGRGERVGIDSKLSRLQVLHAQIRDEKIEINKTR